ncbi:MAG: 50S ribosomal protein L18 [Nitrospira sp.]|nr:50S ribosomal protein L18 [Nitrospira sp.]MCB9709955.1 50S ribosomal protein L18 [Nitrospiraceae bacterium]MDR4487177.1 50S ribosomal protein L18 [Nitrospirales bacterium]MCA9465385.1 50S ribosomal protein L18 [Nitrospira sp.]MCA9474624.1 50S ribosomal protein L18 [Nitrospira sp.]
MNIFEKQKRLKNRKRRVRLRILGTTNRPRLNVFRSNAHIYAQIIDDSVGRTLVSASSCDPGLREKLKSGGNVEAAKIVGETLAERARAIPIDMVVFDRGGRLYHGRVKALAEAARTGGLKF